MCPGDAEQSCHPSSSITTKSQLPHARTGLTGATDPTKRAQLPLCSNRGAPGDTQCRPHLCPASCQAAVWDRGTWKTTRAACTPGLQSCSPSPELTEHPQGSVGTAAVSAQGQGTGWCPGMRPLPVTAATVTQPCWSQGGTGQLTETERSPCRGAGCTAAGLTPKG